MRRFIIIFVSLSIYSNSVSAEPSALIEYEDGFPKITAVNSTCPLSVEGADIRQSIINNASTEWAKFEFPRFSLGRESRFHVIPPGISPKESKTQGGGTSPRLLAVGMMEDDSAVRDAIGSYWASVYEFGNDLYINQNRIWRSSGGRAGWAEYWSAAFVSYVMCRSGLSKNEFKRSAAHRDYIEAAIEARETGSTLYKYKAYDLKEAAPSIGDIICAARSDPNASVNSIQDFKQKTNHSAYHCDIVVGFDTDIALQKPATLYALGGNVMNAVTLTDTPMIGGKLRPLKARHARNWFVILKLDAPASDASMRKAPPAVLNKAEEVRKRREIDNR